MKFETKDDYEKYLSRLEAFSTQVHVQVLATNNKRTLSYHTFAMNSVFSKTQLHFIIAVGIWNNWITQRGSKDTPYTTTANCGKIFFYFWNNNYWSNNY